MWLRRMIEARSTTATAGLFRPDGSLDPKAVRDAVPACLGCGYDLRGLSGLTPRRRSASVWLVSPGTTWVAALGCTQCECERTSLHVRSLRRYAA